MTSQPSNNNLPFGVFNAMVPKEGPKVVPLTVNFSQGASQRVDLTQQQQSGKISFFQSIFIDNSSGAYEVVVTNPTINVSVICPPYSQAILPLFLGNPPVVVASSSNTTIVGMYLFNVPLPAQVWSITGDGEPGFTFSNGKLEVTDTALDALISNQGEGAALNVNVVTTVGSGGSAGVPATLLNSCYLNSTGNNYGSSAGVGNYQFITGIMLIITGDASLTGGGTVNIAGKWASNGSTFFQPYLYIPGTATNSNQMIYVDFSGDPLQSPATNDETDIMLSYALTGGHISVQVYGYNAT